MGTMIFCRVMGAMTIYRRAMATIHAHRWKRCARKTCGRRWQPQFSPGGGRDYNSLQVGGGNHDTVIAGDGIQRYTGGWWRQ